MKRCFGLLVTALLIATASACATAPSPRAAGPTDASVPDPLDDGTTSDVAEAEPSGETRPDPERLNDLRVAPERKRTGYSRSRFKHWSDFDEDGCNTRNEVLIEESFLEITIGPRCRLIGGSWFSPYDGKTTTRPSTFDVDHFVPLAEAWDSGARDWTAEEREQYANDLDHADALIAVTGSSNRSKSDRDPAQWLPSRDEFLCTYAATWIDIKVEWDLAADPDEVAALQEILADC